ncbi:MAG: hypothetical protein ABIF77_04390 [bacterium]
MTSLFSASQAAERYQVEPELMVPVFLVEAAPVAKAAGETVNILGGPNRGDGKFQHDDFPMVPDDECWAPIALTPVGETVWQVDNFNASLLDPAQIPNHAMWCGGYFIPCAGDSFPMVPFRMRTAVADRRRGPDRQHRRL